MTTARNFKTIKVEHHDNGIVVITLSRPDKLNALSELLLTELETTLMTAENDHRVKGLIVTGEGKAFCAGADIGQLAKANAQSGLNFARRGQAVFRLFETIGIPSIAAVNGYAFGGGCELSMAATMRIASDKAQFGQPEVKLGVIPGYGGTVRLPRLIGKGRALEMCITGKSIDAATALQWGLVSEVLAEDQLLQRAQAILTTILSMAPLAVGAVIDCVDAGYDMSLEEAMHLESLHFANTCATEDKKEGVTAFLEKRHADFKGR